MLQNGNFLSCKLLWKENFLMHCLCGQVKNVFLCGLLCSVSLCFTKFTLRYSFFWCQKIGQYMYYDKYLIYVTILRLANCPHCDVTAAVVSSCAYPSIREKKGIKPNTRDRLGTSILYGHVPMALYHPCRELLARLIG